MPLLFRQNKRRRFTNFGRSCLVSEILCNFAVRIDEILALAASKRLKYKRFRHDFGGNGDFGKIIAYAAGVSAYEAEESLGRSKGSAVYALL